MEQKGTTKERLLHLLEQKRDPKALAEKLGVSRQSVHRYLDIFVKKGVVEKFGVPPSVYYLKRKPTIFDTFAYLTPTGELLEGEGAFTEWSKRHLKQISLDEKEKLYIQRIQELEEKKEEGLFSLFGKLRKVEEVGETIHLCSLVVLDLFALEGFGRTRLQYLLEFAKKMGHRKQGRQAIETLIETALPEIERYGKRVEADAIAFVPHTAHRRVQLMEELKKRWKKTYSLPVVEVKKIRGQGMLEQKYIKGIKERIENAEKTFQVTTGPSYMKVVLVDDFVGSGATLNQIAKEIKEIRGAEEVFGLALVGEERGFSVVRGT